MSVDKLFASNEELAEQEQLARDQKNSMQQAKDDLRKVLSLEEGRRVVLHYLNVCGVFRSGFIHSGSETYFKQGERNIGNRLLAECMTAHPEATLAMMKAFFKETKDE